MLLAHCQWAVKTAQTVCRKPILQQDVRKEKQAARVRSKAARATETRVATCRWLQQLQQWQQQQQQQQLQPRLIKHVRANGWYF